MTIDPNDRLLTELEAAKLLRVGYRTLIGWRNRGVIPYLRLNTTIRYRKTALDAWIIASEQGVRK